MPMVDSHRGAPGYFIASGPGKFPKCIRLFTKSCGPWTSIPAQPPLDGPVYTQRCLAMRDMDLKQEIIRISTLSEETAT